MNKLYMEGVQKPKKDYLILWDSKMCIYSSMARVGDNVSTVQKTEVKKKKKDPRIFFMIVMTLNRHIHSLTKV